jgi:hypothetical protein
MCERPRAHWPQLKHSSSRMNAFSDLAAWVESGSGPPEGRGVVHVEAADAVRHDAGPAERQGDVALALLPVQELEEGGRLG